MMRLHLLFSLAAPMLACLAMPAGADPGLASELPFRVVFRYWPQGPASANDYESEVTVDERLPDGSEKKRGVFTGPIFPDDLTTRGRLRDGRYELSLGLHRRCRDGKALTPTPADLVVKHQGWLRPALIVNDDGPVPVHSLNPRKTTSRLIHVHNGFASKRFSEGCLTLGPPDWETFIRIFLSRYRALEDWHQGGRYIGRKVAVLEVRPR
jgi:hypothetical protein